MPLNPFFNAYFGDGCLYKAKSCVNYHVMYDSTNEELINAKHRMFLTWNPTQVKKREQKEYAYGNLPMFSFSMGVKKEATQFANLTLAEKINSMTLWDFMLWYLDDGSYHTRRNSMHLYSYKTGFEGNQLIKKKLEEFDILTTHATDRKKDGRIFHYLYIRRESVDKIMIPKLKLFLKIIDCPSMLYKVGVGSYVKSSSTSRKDVESSTLEMGDTGDCEDIVRTNKKLLEV